MNLIFGDQGAARYKRLRERVEQFRAKYIKYASHDDDDPAARTELLRLLPTAQVACTESGVGRPSLRSPIGAVRVGLQGLAFAHEDPHFTIAHGDRRRSMQMVVDHLDMVIGALVEHERVASERESRWSWRTEQVFRAAFAFPVRLLGIAFGFDPADLSNGQARVASLASIVTYLMPAFPWIWKWAKAQGWW